MVLGVLLPRLTALLNTQSTGSESSSSPGSGSEESSQQPGATRVDLPRAAAQDWGAPLAAYIAAVNGAAAGTLQEDSSSGGGKGSTCVPQMQPSGAELLRVTGCLQVGRYVGVCA